MKLTKPQRHVLQALHDAGGSLPFWVIATGKMWPRVTLFAGCLLIKYGLIEEVNMDKGFGLRAWRLTAAGAAALEEEMP